MIVAFIDIQVSLAVEAHFVWRGQLRGFSRTAVAGIAFRSSAGNDRDFRRAKIPSKHSARAEVGKIHGAIRAAHDMKWIVDLCAVGDVAIRCRPSGTRSD